MNMMKIWDLNHFFHIHSVLQRLIFLSVESHLNYVLRPILCIRRHSLLPIKKFYCAFPIANHSNNFLITIHMFHAWHGMARRVTRTAAPHLINKNMRKLVCQRVCHFDDIRRFPCLANTEKIDRISGSHFLASSVHIPCVVHIVYTVEFKYTEAFEFFYHLFQIDE